MNGKSGNRLSAAKSPYLRQHQNNPVHWWEWGDDAFQEAARTQRPVLLSIGYAACHWCHVMAHESFESESIANLMNALFVNIKVDREERPDIDHIYMSALHALGQQGGWPLTMFLDADRKPFWGGTCFPPESRYGRPGFPDLLRQVATIYRDEPERVVHNGRALTEHLNAVSIPAGDEPRPEEFIAAANRMPSAFDPGNGGLNGAPKFPNAAILNVLWRAGTSANQNALLQPVQKTLQQMARGGIHDHIGGGFARYSVDAEWLVPHFEKMLYDNAQLLELFALAYARTGETLLRNSAEGIVAWLGREMMVGNAFASSLDADSEGEEGKFYVWSRSEIESILGSEDARLFAKIYDISNGGNFEGHNIPNRLRSLDQIPDQERSLESMRRKLLAVRNKRVTPARDDKVLADWNGLMITALVRAGIIQDHAHWIAMARNAHDFIRSSMMRDGALAHSWLDGIGVFPAFALDHAAMALASITLAEATAQNELLNLAAADLAMLHKSYAHPETGILAMTHSGGESLIVRPAPLHDDAVPNANGVYAEALVRMAAMTGEQKYTEWLNQLFRSTGSAMKKAPMAHGSLWSAFDLYLNGAQIIVAGPNREALHQAALKQPFHRRIVVTVDTVESLAPDHPARSMTAIAKDQATAFLCRQGRCEMPVHTASALQARLT